MQNKLSVKSIQKINDEVVIVNESFEYLDFSIDDYKDMFNNLKNKDLIYQGEFDDKEWKISTHRKDKVPTFKFDNEYEYELKGMVLILLDKANLGTERVFSILSAVISFYDKTNSFDINYVDSVVESNMFDAEKGYDIARFLDFIQHENSNEIKNKLMGLSRKSLGPRLLPVFYSVFVFDYLMNDYFEDKNYENMFFPVYLWWKISTVLPLRPVELVSLKRDCLSQKTINGTTTYFITIERMKERQRLTTKKGLDLVYKFAIPYDIWKDLNDYINMANKIDKNIYVFSKEVFDNQIGTPTERRERDYLGVIRFQHLVDRLYTQFSKIYGIKILQKGELEEYDTKKIERILLGDTRHIAICNLMLQGLNPIKIAQMAGHKKVDTQMSYCSHYSDYITSKTKVLQDVISGNIKLKNNKLSFENDNRNAILQKEILGVNYYSLPKVDGGRCSSKYFPNECPLEGCYLCPKLIPDDSIDINKIKQYEKLLNEEIDLKLNYLKKLVKSSVDKNLTEIQSKELELGSIFYQKIWIESYRYLKENNRLSDNSKLLPGGMNNE